jgi:hypothetical protein
MPTLSYEVTKYIKSSEVICRGGYAEDKRLWICAAHPSWRSSLIWTAGLDDGEIRDIGR